MSTINMVSGYADTHAVNAPNEKHGGVIGVLFSASRMAAAKRALVYWFYDPFFWELYEAQRDGGNAAEINRIFEKWGK